MVSVGGYESGLADVVANLPQAVVIVDENCRITYVNNFAPEFFGYSEKGLMGRSLTTLMDARNFKSISQICTHSTDRVVTAEIVRKDGEEVPVEITVAPVLSGDGGYDTLLRFNPLPPKLSKYAHERQLQAASFGAELMHALDAFENSVVIFDDQWRYQFVNKTGWKVLRRNRQDVLGKNVWELRPDLEGTEWAKMAHKAMQNQKKYVVEEYYPRSQKWYITSFYPSPHSIVCHMEDVTALRETQRLNNQLFGTLEEAMETYWSKENQARRHHGRAKSA